MSTPPYTCIIIEKIKAIKMNKHIRKIKMYNMNVLCMSNRFHLSHVLFDSVLKNSSKCSYRSSLKIKKKIIVKVIGKSIFACIFTLYHYVGSISTNSRNGCLSLNSNVNFF